MAFVPVPKDLNRVKTKVMFNLTKRQLICFSILGFAFAVLLFKLQFLLFFDFLLNLSEEIVRAVGTHLVPDEHGLYDVVQILLGGLTVLLVKREEDEREHDDHHQHCRRRPVSYTHLQRVRPAASPASQAGCRSQVFHRL